MRIYFETDPAVTDSTCLVILTGWREWFIWREGRRLRFSAFNPKTDYYDGWKVTISPGLTMFDEADTLEEDIARMEGDGILIIGEHHGKEDQER